MNKIVTSEENEQKKMLIGKYLKHSKYKREHTKHLPETPCLDFDCCYSCGPHSR